jgi:hypothetical protein
MKKLKYKVSIQSPVAKVYDIMLGISKKSTYDEWTSLFSPTSTYEGNWKTGSKMLFVSLDEKGDHAGMVSKILENRENKFVSIQHNGMLKSGEEITEGPDVEEWSGGLENYTFEEENGMTIVSIELDAAEEYKEYMDKLYPNALLKLKEICERDID